MVPNSYFTNLCCILVFLKFMCWHLLFHIEFRLMNSKYLLIVFALNKRNKNKIIRSFN